MRFTQKHADHAARLIEQWHELGRSEGAKQPLPSPEFDDEQRYAYIWRTPESVFIGEFGTLLRRAWRDGFSEAQRQRRWDVEQYIKEHEKRLHGDSESVVETRVATDYEVTLTFDPEFIDEARETRQWWQERRPR